MRNSNKLLAGLFAVIGASLVGAQAQAMDVSLYGSGSMLSRNFTTMPGVSFTGGSASITFGGGLALTHYFSPSIGVQIGGEYRPLGGTANFSGSATHAVLGAYTYTVAATQTVNYLRFPLLARYKINDMFSGGLGMYLATGIGNITGTNVQVASNALLSGTSTFDSTWEALNANKFDWGFAASFDFKFPLTTSLSLLADARFYLGIPNTLSASNTLVSGTNIRTIDLLVGVNYKF